MTNNHASRIIDAITPDTLKDGLGWTDRAIRHAKSSGQFSGLWYLPLKELCERHGIYCPPEAFIWKAPAKKNGMDTPEIQGLSK